MKYINEIQDFFNCNINEINYISNNEDSTKNFAKEFAKFLSQNNVISLNR